MKAMVASLVELAAEPPVLMPPDVQADDPLAKPVLPPGVRGVNSAGRRLGCGKCRDSLVGCRICRNPKYKATAEARVSY